MVAEIIGQGRPLRGGEDDEKEKKKFFLISLFQKLKIKNDFLSDVLFSFYLRRNATGKDLPTSDLDGMMNGLLEDRQRTPLLVIGERPHPSHSRT